MAERPRDGGWGRNRVGDGAEIWPSFGAMEGVQFLADLAVVAVLAGLAGWACRGLGLSPVVGFLLAGVVIGPHSGPFPLVSDLGSVHTLAQTGLVFLMFGIGLKMGLGRLKRLGGLMVLAVVASSLLLLLLGRVMGLICGLNPVQGFFLAGVLMVSSSAVIVKVLQDVGRAHDRSGQMATGITVLEDVVAVVVVSVLVSITRVDADTGEGLSLVIGSLASFVVLLVIIGLLVLPRLLKLLNRTAAPDLRLLLVVGLLLGAALAAHSFGYSVALGAFLVGAVVAGTGQRRQVEKQFEGLRDLFSAVFFVAMGMLMDWHLLGQVWLWALGLGLFAFVARMMSVAVALMAVGKPPVVAWQTGLQVAPLGEFSFVIAQLGVAVGVMGPEFYPMVVGGAFVTCVLVPFAVRHDRFWSRMMLAVTPQWLDQAVANYQGLLANLAREWERNRLFQLVRPRLVQIAVTLLVVTGVLVGAGHFARPLRGWVMENWGPEVHLWIGIGYWVMVGGLVLAPLFAVWRNASALGLMFSEVGLRGHPSRVRLRPLAQAGFQLLTLGFLAVWFWQFLPASSLGWHGLLICLVLLAGALWLFSRRLVYLQSHLEIDVQRALGEATDPVHTAWLRSKEDWALEIHEVELPDQSQYAGKCLRDLELRTRFGVSVVAVERHGVLIASPSAEERVFSGDVLLILGEHSQVELARQMLASEQHTESGMELSEVQVEQVRLEVPGDWAGRTLSESEFGKKTGLQVVGLERNGFKSLNVSPADTLQPGDVLLVVGAPEKIEAFRHQVTASSI